MERQTDSPRSAHCPSAGNVGNDQGTGGLGTTRLASPG